MKKGAWLRLAGDRIFTRRTHWSRAGLMLALDRWYGRMLRGMSPVYMNARRGRR